MTHTKERARFTPAMDAILLARYEARVPLLAIAEELGVSRRSVDHRVARITVRHARRPPGSKPAAQPSTAHRPGIAPERTRAGKEPLPVGHPITWGAITHTTARMHQATPPMPPS